jgi:hypothetical protein
VVCRRHGRPGRNPPFWAVKRPHKSAVEPRFTAGECEGRFGAPGRPGRRRAARRGRRPRPAPRGRPGPAVSGAARPPSCPTAPSDGLRALSPPHGPPYTQAYARVRSLDDCLMISQLLEENCPGTSGPAGAGRSAKSARPRRGGAARGRGGGRAPPSGSPPAAPIRGPHGHSALPLPALIGILHINESRARNNSQIPS